MYRHPRVAEQAQVQALRADLGELREKLASIARERDTARAELERMREGIDYDPAIDAHRGFVLTRRGMGVLVAIGAALVSSAVAATLVAFFDAPLLTMRGVENAFFHLQHGRGALGVAYASLLALVASPWIVAPALAARGLRAHRVWGWVMAVLSCLLYLPTPMLPLSAIGLGVLLSRRVRRVYFPVSAR